MPPLFDRFSKKSPKNKTSELRLKIGAVVNQHYRLDELIARGGMGFIFRAYDLSAEKEVAFKVINSDTENVLSLGQFRREAEALSKLRHPHIVSLHESGFVDGNESMPFIAMELLHGKLLSEIGALTYARILSIAKQLCETLAYIHEQGFVYRDIKPNNVMVDKHGFDLYIKLVDFGLARPRGEPYLPNESSLAGTSFYLAPELVEGASADISSDLYAFGVLLYELVTGRVPFSDVDEKRVLSQHQFEKPVAPSQSRPDIPPQLERLILNLLEKNPSNRPATANAVLALLNELVLNDTLRGNLPLDIPQIQENDIRPIVHLLEENPLVTLPDADYSLTLAAANCLNRYFPDGVWCVDLQQVTDPTVVISAVMSALGIEIDSNRPPVVKLIEFLHEKNLLLILAHCGHVSGACAQCVSAVISSCPDVRLMAVSDRLLGHPAEKYYSSQSNTL